jgi:hypothetical protein
MTRLLLLCGLTLTLVAPPISAQTGPQSQAVLHFEISKNGTLVGQPTLRMRIGDKASLAINGGPTFTVELGRDDGVIEAICEFQADAARATLRMKLGQEPASAKVPIGKDTFEIKIALNPPK